MPSTVQQVMAQEDACRSHLIGVKHVEQPRMLMEIKQRPDWQGGWNVCRIHGWCRVDWAAKLMEQLQIVCTPHGNISNMHGAHTLACMH